MEPLIPDPHSLTESLYPPRYNALKAQGASGEEVSLENFASQADPEHPDYLGRRVEPRDALQRPEPFQFPDLSGPAFQFAARRLYERLCVSERWYRFTAELVTVTDQETGAEREPRKWDLLSITRGEGEPGSPEAVTVDSYEPFWDGERGRERARLEVKVGVHEPLYPVSISFTEQPFLARMAPATREFLEARPCGALSEEFMVVSEGDCPHLRSELADATTGARVCSACGNPVS